MAREHARLLCRIWSDKEFTALPGDVQRTYMLLTSQRLLNHAGVVPMTLQKWANTSPDTTTDDVLRCLEQLAKARFVVFDPATDELLIRSHIRNDGVAKQPNVLKAALRQALDIDSPLLRQALAVELRRLGNEAADQTADELDRKAAESPAEPLANPSGTPHSEPLAKGSPETRGKGKGLRTPEDSPSVGGPVRSPHSQANAARRGTRIPDDFTVTDEMVAWHREHAPDVDGRTATAAFIDYWRAKAGRDATKLDWPATWRNWMRREQDKRSGQRPRASPNGHSQTDANIVAFLGRTTNPSPLRALPGGDP